MTNGEVRVELDQRVTIIMIDMKDDGSIDPASGSGFIEFRIDLFL